MALYDRKPYASEAYPAGEDLLHPFYGGTLRVNGEDGRPEMERIPIEDRVAWMKLQCSDCMTGIMHCLNNEDRLIYLFRKLTPLGYGEIAEITGRNEAAVRQSF